MKKILFVLALSLFFVGNISAKEFMVCGSPNVGVSVSSDATSFNAGGQLRLEGIRHLEIGMTFLEQRLYFSKENMGANDWSFQIGGYGIYHFLEENRFRPGFFLGVFKNIGNGYNPVLYKAGFDFDLFNFALFDTQKMFIDLTAGYQYRSGFERNGVKDYSGSNGFFISFGMH